MPQRGVNRTLAGVFFGGGFCFFLFFLPSALHYGLVPTLKEKEGDFPRASPALLTFGISRTKQWCKDFKALEIN